jgi:hypothetical protein
MRRLMLREEDRVYFLHIPKTAGSSFVELLHNYLPDEKRPHYLLADLLNPPETLLEQRLIVGHTYYTLHHFLPRPPIYVTMLRDPAEQVVSHFRHIKRYPEHHLYEKYRNKTLLDFLRDQDMVRVITNFQTHSLAVDADPRVLAKNLTPEELNRSILDELMLGMYDHLSEGELLEYVKARLKDFAFVGITERFDDTVDLLTYTFHWQPFRQSVNLNRDPNPFLDIPQSAKDLIAEHTEIDRQLYQFALDLFETRRREMILDLLKTDQIYGTPGTMDFLISVEEIPPESAPYLNDSHGWSDGWVGPRWVLPMPMPQMRQLKITGMILLEYLKNPLTLTICVGGRQVEQLEITQPDNFSIEIPLTGSPVEILADQYFIAAQVGLNPDKRPLSWRIVEMKFVR